MKTLLTCMLMLASADALAAVQVSQQNGILTLSADDPPPGWHYTGAEVVIGGLHADLDLVSPNCWQLSTPVVSGEYILYLCSSDSCSFIEGSFSGGPEFWWLIMVAMGCGALMNLMPCVLPVLGLKLSAFGVTSKRLAYIAGVMASFMVLATLSIALGTGLSQMGFSWYRMTLSVVCFLMGLQLLGAWRMPSLGFSGSYGPFGMGCLTVALGTSCAVPFIAPVMAYTTTCTWIETYLLFAALGGGFCSPFILPIKRVPGFLRHYVSQFEIGCGIAMVIVSAWLFSTLQFGQFLVGAWYSFMFIMLFHSGNSALVRLLFQSGKIALVSFTLVVAAGPVVGVVSVVTNIPVVTNVPVVGSGPIVVFVTAEWCINCKAMKSTINDPRVREYMEDNNIELVTLDYTDRDISIRKFLASVKPGLRDVPVLLIESNAGVVTVLTGLWTTDQVIQALQAE